jgi:putative transposase
MLIIATLNRWLIKYSSSLALAAKKCKWIVASSWRMDETYLKVKGQWVYLYRAVDIFGDTVGFMLSEHRDEAAATGFPSKVVIQNSKAVPLESGLACNQSTGQDRTFS